MKYVDKVGIAICSLLVVFAMCVATSANHGFIARRQNTKAAALNAQAAKLNFKAQQLSAQAIHAQQFNAHAQQFRYVPVPVQSFSSGGCHDGNLQLRQNFSNGCSSLYGN